MDKKIIVEAPDQYGLPTDDEIRANIEKEYERRRQERDTAYQKKDQERRDKEARELKTQELAKKGQEVATKLGDNPSFEQAFDELVPQSGACESIGGELLRAVNKMEYRWYNDGDKFYEGYGLETCGSCAAYVVDIVERYMEEDDTNGYSAIPDDIRNCAEGNYSDDEYSDFIDALKEHIVGFVFKAHPETLGTPVEEDCIHWTDPSEYWEDYIPKYEVELSIPYEVIEYYDKSKGDFDIFNVIDYVQTELDNYNPTFGAEVDTPWGHYDEYVLVKNLSKEGKNEVENWNNGGFFDGLLDELRDKYNDEDYSEEDEAETDESLKESQAQFTTIEDAFKDVSGEQEVFDKEGHFAIDYEKYAQKVADKYFGGNIDKVDAMCSEEGCFNESIKEDNGGEIMNESFNSQEFDEFMRLSAQLGLKNMGDVDKFSKEHNNAKDQALLQAMRDAVAKKDECKESVKEDFNDERLANCDAWYYVGKYEDEDFMIVDSWDDVQEIQKCLNPDFQPKDKYDSSVLDEYINWGFEDAYSTCDECGKIICTEPDSYSWVPDFFVSEGGIICGDCVRNNPSEYLQSLINNPKVANTILGDDDLEYAGFERMGGDYQNGWYDRNDSPEEILDNLLEQYPNGVFIFSITGQGQFATNFEVWGESNSLDEVEEETEEE